MSRILFYETAASTGMEPPTRFVPIFPGIQITYLGAFITPKNVQGGVIESTWVTKMDQDRKYQYIKNRRFSSCVQGHWRLP